MNYKEWSAYDVEIMNDVLRLIRENGGSMLEEAVGESIHRFYENKYQEKYRENTIVFTKKLDDIYIDMIRRGWMYRDGKSLYLSDKGRRVEKKGSAPQIVTEREIEQTDELLQGMLRPRWWDKMKPYIPWAVALLVVSALLWLLLSGAKSKEWIIEKAIDILT